LKIEARKMTKEIVEELKEEKQLADLYNSKETYV